MLRNYFCTMLFIAGTTTVPLYSMATTMGEGTAEQMALLQQEQQQIKQVKGFIGDENGDPVIGATVLEKGKANGTTTDTDGTFTLNIPGNATLVVSYVGYKTKEVRVNNRSFIVTSLIPEEKLLNEVVVVGFGKQKKESLVGAVQSVKPEDLKMTSSSLTTSFAGNVPGIIARQTQGEPGYDNAEFYIRGVSTFGANNQPLIILDGAEITSEMLNNIPPESIESFSVLKDATATSLYGSRGANGVIIVNTRQGSASEKMSVNIRFDNTFSMPTTIQDMPDGPTYMRMFNEASKNDARIADATYEQPYSDERIQRTIENANPYIFPNVNWYKTLFKDFAANQNLNINLKGGTRFIDYFLNAGIFYENGIMKQPKESEALDVQQRTQKYFFQSTRLFHLNFKSVYKALTRFRVSRVNFNISKISYLSLV